MFRAVSLVDDLDSNRYIGLRFNLFHTWLNLFTCQPSTSSSMLSRHPVASLAVAAVLVTSPKGELRETWAIFFTLRHNIFIFGSFFSEFEQLSCRSPWHHYCQVWHEAWMNLPPICQLGSTTKVTPTRIPSSPKKILHFTVPKSPFRRHQRPAPKIAIFLPCQKQSHGMLNRYPWSKAASHMKLGGKSMDENGTVRYLRVSIGNVRGPLFYVGFGTIPSYTSYW